ncbi:MAG: PHP domain-containing protein [Candidatus Lokiarchaeota archaeon]|nr:PHP domain-containing protein [Candidatus Lokiarchaeota archaeon]
MLKFDPHVHTRFSDGSIFYNGIADLKYLAKRDKITAFAVTDHNTTRGMKYARRACEVLGIPFIPGIEISAREGHLVAYGVTEWTKGAYQLTVDEVIDELVSLNAVIVVAHPMSKRMGIKKLLFEHHVYKRIDGFEYFNGATPTNAVNLHKHGIAPLSGLCRYAGSDCHSHVLFARFHVLVDAPATKLDDILEAMRDKHKVTAVGPIMDIPTWIADFPPAFTKRRVIKQLEHRGKEKE